MASKVSAASFHALLSAAARVSEDVTLSSGGALPVRGLTVIEFVSILGKFPELRDSILSFFGFDGRTKEEKADMDSIVAGIDLFAAIGPDCLALILATAIGKGKDEQIREDLLNLGDEDFFTLVSKVSDLTMPNGLADFIARVIGVLERMGLVERPPVEGEEQPFEEAA